MPHPTAFLGTPALHPGPTPAQPYDPGAYAPARVVLPRSVPTLTVYADGHLNLNGEASALLSGLSDGLCLHRPKKTRAGRPSPPWEVRAGTCERLVGRADKPGHLRCWPAPTDCPPPGRYLLTPLAGYPERFTLVPV